MITLSRRGIALMSLLLLSAAPSAQTMSSGEQAAVQKALDRGQLLYAYDQAAWHGTDALTAAAKARGFPDVRSLELGGWVVTGDAATPRVIFYDANVAEPHAVFLAATANGGQSVTDAHFVGPGEDATVSPAAVALIRAHAAALASIEGTPVLRCSDRPYNTVVLAPDDETHATHVYLLTPQTDIAKVPFGGHLRIDVPVGGKAGPAHAFTRSCMDVPTAHAKDRPEAIGMTQLNDPVPTEVDVFTMFAADLPIYVITPPDGRIWSIEALSGRAEVRIVAGKPKN